MATARAVKSFSTTLKIPRVIVVGGYNSYQSYGWQTFYIAASSQPAVRFVRVYVHCSEYYIYYCTVDYNVCSIIHLLDD